LQESGDVLTAAFVEEFRSPGLPTSIRFQQHLAAITAYLRER